MATLEILDIARHRNGTTGEGFYGVLFLDKEQDNTKKIATVFDTPGYISVLSVDLLSLEDVHSESWRGDWYEPVLRRAIKSWERKKERVTS